MEYGASVLSLVFILTAFIYILVGIYIIRRNKRERVNRAFFLTSIFLFLWSFGYAMLILAKSPAEAVLWKKLSSLGEIFLFATILHFMLLLANRDTSERNKKLFLLIYIPALIFTYIFALSKFSPLIEQNMMEVDYGWLARPVNDLWSFFYYIYMSLYLVSSLIIVNKWKKMFKNKSIKRQANIFYITFTLAFFLGVFTDLVLSRILNNPLPQLSPIFALFPLGAMYYSSKNYDILNVKIVAKEEIILSEDQQEKIFISFSIGIIISGLLNFIFEYFSNSTEARGNLRLSILRSLSIIILGITIFLLQKIKDRSLKRNLTLGLLILSIPLIIFKFLNYSSVTIWIYPIVVLISCILFSRRIFMLLTTILAIITQRFLWILRPEIDVLVDKYDYILRIGVFIFIFLIGLYINKVYIDKLKENNNKIAFQKIDSHISWDLISLNKNNFDRKVDSFLENIAGFFQLDRVYLSLIDYESQSMSYSNQWWNEELTLYREKYGEKDLEKLSPWLNKLKDKDFILIENTEDMDDEVDFYKKELLERGVKSLALVPIRDGDKVKAYIGVESILSSKKWTQENIKLLKIMVNRLNSAMIQMKSSEEINFMAYNDHLTGLANRFLFAERVNRAIDLARENSSLLSVIFIDLDNFKLVNDTIGHEGGDILLKEVAKALVNTVEEGDLVGRFGGDEFLIMLKNIKDSKSINKMAEKIMKVFSHTFMVNGQEFSITASAGLASYPLDGSDSETLVKNADIAMYKAKDKGKNRYSLCTENMKEETKNNIDLSNDLYQALERGEFQIYYQPQIDLLSQEIIGVEALLRWLHPSRGMVSPGLFIPIAEKNGLINTIGQWVLETACLQNKKWQDMGLAHINMAVNLSAIQLMNPKLVEVVERIIRESGLDSKYIELEITESLAINENIDVLEILDKLKKIGVSIAIDDFGTQYSSLSRLKQLPADRIKIDMEFVQGIESNKKDKAITQIIIDLAKSLDLKVLAEGVETSPQLNFLNKKMCDEVQGYYYYRPMPGEELEELLKKYV